MKKSEVKQLIKEWILENKENVDEISPELFKKATDISRERGQDQRTVKMGQTFFNKFKGKPLMGGVIEDIWYTKPQQGDYEEVGVKVKHSFPNAEVVPDSLKYDYLYYDVWFDEWKITDEITRADARLLSLIAQHINPETRYKSGGEGFRIKGYGMSENSEKDKSGLPFALAANIVKYGQPQTPKGAKKTDLTKKQEKKMKKTAEKLKKSLKENSEKYMFFQNLETIKNAVEEMLSLNPDEIDAILANGHDWASDHISTSKDDVQEVRDFLLNNKAPMGEELKGGQKKLDVAEPKGKITKADFDALRAMKKKK